jgi:hypothetical protein
MSEYKPGDPIFALSNGEVSTAGVTLETKSHQVLAVRQHSVHPYVIWNVDEKGNPFSGRYFSDLAEALKTFRGKDL